MATAETAEEKAAQDAAVKAQEAAAAAAKANEDQATANAKAVKANEERAAKDARDEAAANAKLPVEIVGRVGGAFNIEGAGFGSAGTLFIGGRSINITVWSDKKIKGQLPEGVSGAVVLTTETGVRHGIFPSKK